MTIESLSSGIQPLSDDLTTCFASCGTPDGCAPKYEVTFHLENKDLGVTDIGFDYHALPLPPAALEACVKAVLPNARFAGKTPVSDAILIPTARLSLIRPGADVLAKLALKRDAEIRDFDGEMLKTISANGALDAGRVGTVITARSGTRAATCLPSKRHGVHRERAMIGV